jgi:hypothetical protein
VKKTERNGRARLFARVQAAIGQQLEAFCGAAGVTESAAPDAKAAARLTAESRYQQFVEHVGEQFFGGKRFFDDLPREILADGDELAAHAQEPVSASPILPTAEPSGSL